MAEAALDDFRVLILRVAYDGTGFSGYAKQPGRRTVEGVLEDALRTVIRSPYTLQISVAGRTDAGVHALGQVVSVTTDSDIDSRHLFRSLSRLLPRDVAVTVEEGRPGFEARKSAVKRRYRYKLLTSDRPDPLRRTRVWWVGKLTANAQSILHEAAEMILGTHDFSAFCKRDGKASRVGGETSGIAPPSCVRTVTLSRWSRPACIEECCSEELWFDIEANAFCRHMIRRLVGAMVHWAQNNEQPVPVEEVHAYSWKPAPSHGLYLLDVEYALEGRSNTSENGED